MWWELPWGRWGSWFSCRIVYISSLGHSPLHTHSMYTRPTWPDPLPEQQNIHYKVTANIHFKSQQKHFNDLLQSLCDWERMRAQGLQRQNHKYCDSKQKTILGTYLFWIFIPSFRTKIPSNHCNWNPLIQHQVLICQRSNEDKWFRKAQVRETSAGQTA